MKKNVGLYDRIARVFLGIGIFGGSAASGIPAVIILGIIIGLVFIVTGFIGFCPMYIVFQQYLPSAPVQSPAERRHTSRSDMLLRSQKHDAPSGAETRMSSNRTSFRS
jgi:hypothetical protein